MSVISRTNIKRRDQATYLCHTCHGAYIAASCNRSEMVLAMCNLDCRPLASTWSLRRRCELSAIPSTATLACRWSLARPTRGTCPRKLLMRVSRKGGQEFIWMLGCNVLIGLCPRIDKRPTDKSEPCMPDILGDFPSAAKRSPVLGRLR